MARAVREEFAMQKGLVTPRVETLGVFLWIDEKYS